MQRKNIISNQFIHNFIEKSLKLVLINTPKLNFKFLFDLSVEEKDISRNEETFKDERVISKVNIKNERSLVLGVFTRSKNDGLKK